MQVPNIVGAIRFTYGFHRTGSEEGVILDMWLGAECVANVCSDIAVNLLLWKALAGVDGVQHVLYADDITIWATTGNIGVMEECLQAAASIVDHHATYCGLECSPSKSQFVHIRPSPKCKISVQLSLASGPIREVEEIRILGLFINQHRKADTTLAKLRKVGDQAQMLPVLRAFVVWNTAALLFCCAGNLAGLRYPPKWWTHVDADKVTATQRVALVAVWTPVITVAALCKIYYTAQLYRFYRTYKDTGGKAFDGASMAATRSVRAEGDRTSIVHTPDDVTAPNLSKSMEGTTLTTKSQSFGVKSHRLSAAAEDQTTTIQPRGTKSGKFGNRSRRQSVTSKSRTTPVLPPRTKSGKFGDRSRRHSGPAEERTTTLLPPGKKPGKLGGRSQASIGVAQNAAKPPGGKSKGQAVGAVGRGTASAASTTRSKPAIRESRRSSFLAAGGTQKDGKKSQRPSGTSAADARAVAETIRKAAPRSRRQSVTDGGGSTQRPSSVGSTPPLQTSRRQSVAGLAAVAAAQLAAQNRARRKSLTGADATGVGAASTPKKSI
ncbi:uncharacterized protein LOC119448276 [Dermacentor silvarum]|uniref:uncharacterized protein LOC119448276 n=1 Tax=Dermacentor silvarum TaxID=543639 RepID=UPI00210097AD|nr:uncharacterized protein LOC119448276 [Dermacentor silvarum]